MTARQRLRQAPYALRLVRRADGEAVIVYRRAPNPERRDRLRRLATIAPLALTAGEGLLRRATKHGSTAEGQPANKNGNGKDRHTWPPPAGPYQPLAADWGARLACYALIARGLRDAERLSRAARRLEDFSGADAAWWVGLLTGPDAERAQRALRILTGAVV